MAKMTGEADLDRAKDIRKRASSVGSETAKRTLKATADRLEERGTRKLAKLGRKRRKTPRTLALIPRS